MSRLPVDHVRRNHQSIVRAPLEIPHASANHSQLSPLESEVLWEYAKLADKLKRVSCWGVAI